MRTETRIDTAIVQRRAGLARTLTADLAALKSYAEEHLGTERAERLWWGSQASRLEADLTRLASAPDLTRLSQADAYEQEWALRRLEKYAPSRLRSLQRSVYDAVLAAQRPASVAVAVERKFTSAVGPRVDPLEDLFRGGEEQEARDAVQAAEKLGQAAVTPEQRQAAAEAMIKAGSRAAKLGVG